MILNELYLKNFRNIKEEKIKFFPGLNVLCGENAQGKTNIIEAIYMCTCARSHRTNKDQEMIFYHEDFYEIDIKFKKEKSDEEEINLKYFENYNNFGKPQRIISNNAFKLEKIGDLMGIFHAVIFAPEDLYMVKEGPNVRRRFLDLLISQLSPSYFFYLQNYVKLLAQRNKLLKKYREQQSSESLDLQLEIWTEKMAEMAANIMWKRKEIILQIEKFASTVMKKISEEKEDFFIKYLTNPDINKCAAKETFEKLLIQKYAQTKSDDILRGNTSIGPQRDDLIFMINEKKVKSFASQGQQRSVVLALKLAELKIIEQETKEMPVLLLDDVLSELDKTRSNFLLEQLDCDQIIMSATDSDIFLKEKKEKGQFYWVEKGQIQKQKT